MGLAFSLYLEKVRIKAKVERYFKIIKEKDCQKKLDLFIGTSLQKKIDYQKDKVELKTF